MYEEVPLLNYSRVLYRERTVFLAYNYLLYSAVYTISFITFEARKQKEDLFTPDPPTLRSCLQYLPPFFRIDVFITFPI